VVIVLLANRIHPIARKSRFAFRPRAHDIVMEGLGFPPPPREKRPQAGEADAGPQGGEAVAAAPDNGAGPSGDSRP
ncbi:MAG: hypothetical protein Q8R92_03945, partial [Deltaproteobacteria bacterium]|nr:hypothetical protein [Deltaproteobacteria bacterium]